MGIEIVYMLYELCINLVKLNVMLIKNDVYDIFEKIKAFMIHGKYKAEKKIYWKLCLSWKLEPK